MLENSGKLMKAAGRKIRVGMILRSIVRKYILRVVVGWNWIRRTSSDWFADERRLFCDFFPTALFTVTHLRRHREYCVVLTWYLATCAPPTSLSLTYRAADYTWHARDKNEGQSEQRIVTSISVTCTLMHPITVTTLPTLNPSAL